MMSMWLDDMREGMHLCVLRAYHEVFYRTHMPILLDILQPFLR